MTQEEKSLLLKDLSARLPYGVKFTTDIKGVWTLSCITSFKENGDIIYCPNIVNRIDCIKPYLRPMSSMTEEEKEEYHKLCDSYYDIYFDTIDSIDWLNKNHFDYRNLIPKDLAIAVTAKNNPYKRTCMDEESRQLLLMDLTSRLPYNVIVFHPDYDEPQTLDTIFNFNSVSNGGIHSDVDDISDHPKELTRCKPYLRPMSSMTEDELKTYNELIYCEDDRYFLSFRCSEVVAWLDKNMFDHRGLIPKGLAIEITSENNPYKE